MKETNSFQKVVFRPWADTHVGETAVVIGNGESLNDVPKELLEKYPTFGTNHVYLVPFQPTYYVCVDEVVLMHFPEAIHATAERADIAFLHEELEGEPNWATRKLFTLPSVYRYNEYTIRCPGENWITGGTVTYVALKIAYGMGFSTALVVGCDRDKEWKHFSEEYPRFGTREPYVWRTQEYHLRIVGEMFKRDGRRIINLSPPSGLDEFYERGNTEDWL